MVDCDEPSCEWHGKDEPLEPEDPPCCPNCQRLLTTRTCGRCGEEFLDWEPCTADDMMASPCASSDGDLCCSGCIERVENLIAMREDESDEGDFFDPYDDIP